MGRIDQSPAQRIFERVNVGPEDRRDDERSVVERSHALHAGEEDPVAHDIIGSIGR